MLLFVAVGVVYYFISPASGEEIANKLISEFKERGILTEKDLLKKTLLIFLNNAKAVGLAALLGISGIIPVFIVVGNGFLIGLFSAYVYVNSNASLMSLLLALLPHGIIEIPAVLLACSGGLRWFLLVVQRRDMSLKMRIFEGFRLAFYSFMVSLPMLLLAAFIEVYITPIIVKMSL